MYKKKQINFLQLHRLHLYQCQMPPDTESTIRFRPSVLRVRACEHEARSCINFDLIARIDIEGKGKPQRKSNANHDKMSDASSFHLTFKSFQSSVATKGLPLSWGNSLLPSRFHNLAPKVRCCAPLLRPPCGYSDHQKKAPKR